MKKLYVAFLLLLISNISFAENKKCNFLSSRLFQELSHGLRAKDGFGLRLLCKDPTNKPFEINFVDGQARFFKSELDGKSVKSKRGNVIENGILNVDLTAHKGDSYIVKSYSWELANGASKDIPSTNGKMAKKLINCKRKDKFWLKEQANRDQCKKYDICYGPIHSDQIQLGMCKKVTNNGREFQKTRGFKP